MSTLRHLLVDANSTTFANPADPSHTLRFVRRMQNKKAGPYSLMNLNSSIRSLKRLPVGTLGENGVPTMETVSIRTEVSGSRENAVAIATMLDAHIANLQLARADLLAGFLPPVTSTFVVTAE